MRARRSGAGGERIKVQLTDGSCFFLFEEDIREAGISPAELTAGYRFSQAVLKRLEEHSLRRRARDKALSLLARSAHSTFSLRAKLLSRGWDTAVVRETLAWLSERGYLDDRRYAEQWVHSRLERHPEGRMVLASGLMRRGVSRHLAEEVTLELVSAAAERENARRALERFQRLGEREPERLMRKLKARGFAFPLIRELVRRPEEQSEGQG